MQYIYDSALKGVERTQSFTRFGTTFKLEARHKMGDSTYYTFSNPGSEKLMVIPKFMQEYLEIVKKISNLGSGKTYEQYRRYLRNMIELEEEDEFESDTSDDGIMKVLSGMYKDIGITIHYENKNLKVTKDFEIRQNNIFGNGITVSLPDEESN